MEKEKAAAIADEIINLYQQFGNADYIGEPVSQIEHMCQCAQIAEKKGYNKELILAAFFHDIGHLCEQFMEVEQMGGFGVVNHEKIGADFILKKGFSPIIAELINSHVDAKRYLTYAYPTYYSQLSEASKKTLVHQGGKMTKEEAMIFEANPHFEWFIVLRKWDELAKEENVPLPNLDHYKKLMILHLVTQ
jgi:phosphonate degradation associated HDIG domain protein